MATIMPANRDIHARQVPESSPSSPEPGTAKKKTSKPRPHSKSVRNDGSVLHRRSRDGCYTCRLRRKKCDETTPICKACNNLQLTCEYSKPIWWDHPELRQKHKAKIKEGIRSIKPHNAHPISKPPITKTPLIQQALTNTPPSLCHSQPTSGTFSEPFMHTRRPSADSTFSPRIPLDTPHVYFDATPHMPAPQWTPYLHYPQFAPPPWEFDVKTERQMYVDGIPTKRDETMSTFGAYEPPTPALMPPAHSNTAWTKHGSYEITTTESFSEDLLEPNFFVFAHEPTTPGQQTVIQVEDCDRPLLNHFIENVTPFIFSVLDVKQKGSSLSDVILPQLENNPIYLHCCLSTAALHLKITEHIEGEQIDNDIIRHRAATITSLCEAFADDSVDPSRLLEATLGMILFQSSVGSVDDGLPDIPWHAHFQAVASLMDKIQQLQFPEPKSTGHHATFNLTLTFWIDILGATALRRVPIFADIYRERLEAQRLSGLSELMGCEDRVMYLISEIACLDALQETVKMDDLTLCTHITNLGDRLTQTEYGQAEPASVYTAGTDAIRPRQLSHNFTAIFRFAARIYLCSLVPDFDRHQSSIMGLVDSLTDAIRYIPQGHNGFDRALVWPLVVAGSVSVPASPFREMFRARAVQLGQVAELGSFGRVKELLEEVWCVNDGYTAKGEKLGIHWRDVMAHKQVDYLII